MYNIAMLLGGIVLVVCGVSTHAMFIHHKATPRLKILILESHTFTSMVRRGKFHITTVCVL